MNENLTIECQVHFCRRGHGSRKELRGGCQPLLPPGRTLRLARLMALAIRCEQLRRSGQITGYAQLAELGHVSRARVSQIMNLLNLAPDIQEQILFLPRLQEGRAPIPLKQLQPIASVADWRRQRRLWAQLCKQAQL